MNITIGSLIERTTVGCEKIYYLSVNPVDSYLPMKIKISHLRSLIRDVLISEKKTAREPKKSKLRLPKGMNSRSPENFYDDLDEGHVDPSNVEYTQPNREGDGDGGYPWDT